MTAQTIRNPRGAVPTGNRNECINPSFETNLDYWYPQWFGANATGLDQRVSGANVPRFGTYAMQKKWTTGPSTDGDGVGWTYSMPFWTQYMTKWVGAWFWTSRQQPCTIHCRYYDSSNNLINDEFGDEVVVPVGQWVSLGNSFTAPAGTVKVDVWFTTSENAQNWQVNDKFLLDGVLITAQTPPVVYYDGSSAQNGPQTYAWAGVPHASESIELQPDPRTIVTPWDLLGYDTSYPSRNTVHELLSGEVLVVLRDASTRTGTLRFLFLDREPAWDCIDMHNESGVWEYSDSRMPQVYMHYVINEGGQLRVYQDDSRKRWVVEIPYREVLA